jgi:hypothetical protein
MPDYYDILRALWLLAIITRIGTVKYSETDVGGLAKSDSREPKHL